MSSVAFLVNIVLEVLDSPIRHEKVLKGKGLEWKKQNYNYLQMIGLYMYKIQESTI